MNILIGIGVYFVLGLMALGALDIATRRIRNRLSSASQEARDKLMISGSLVSTKEAIILTVGALWLFWPLVVFSALKGGNSGQKR